MTTVTPTKKYTKGQLAEKLMPQLRCIEREDFRSWLATAPDRYEYPQSLLRTFCSDCTPAYQAEMQTEGPCINDEPIVEIDPLTPEVYDDISELRAQGLKVREVVERLEFSRSTVFRALERAKKRRAAGL